MGDGRDRIVTAPANKATGYGIAAASAVGRALGEAGDAIGTDLQQLNAGLEELVVEDWVLDARALWAQLANGDPAVSKVTLLNLDWWAPRAAKASGKPVIAELTRMGYAAWTNSSSLVLVEPSLMAGTDVLAKILLSHEMLHVRQFRSIGDRPPQTYWDMAYFEQNAYVPAFNSLDALVRAGETQYTDARDEIKELVTFFSGIAGSPKGKVSEAEILKAYLGHTYLGKRDPLLPHGSGPTPDSLYVR